MGVYETAIPDDAIIIHEVVNGRQEPAWAVDSDIPPADWGDNEGTPVNQHTCNLINFFCAWGESSKIKKKSIFRKLARF